MIAIKVKVPVRQTIAFLQRVRDGLSTQALDPVIEAVAFEVLARIVELTPKKWFGQVRRSWQILHPEEATYAVLNDNPIMTYLEKGTRDHGPVHRKALFIPLTRRAALAAAAGHFQGLKYGEDYVLAKRVRGIRARRIIENFSDEAEQILLRAVGEYLKQLIDG